MATYIHHGALSPTTSEPGFDAANPQKCRICVGFTSIEGTFAALKAASAFGHQLLTSVRILVPAVVPFRYPLEAPPFSTAFFERLALAVLQEAQINCDETNIEVCVCRERLDAFKQMLKPGSLVILGGRKRWRWIEGRKLADSLRELGHQVILVPVTDKQALARMFGPHGALADPQFIRNCHQ